MHKSSNKVKLLKIINELAATLEVRYSVSIPELNKLENIIINENMNDNIQEVFGFAYRRIQEIGIYDEDIDNLFQEMYQYLLN